MNLFAIIANLRFQDVLDILFLSMVAYHLYLWFWGTKAFKALVGLLALGVVFTVARFWGLFLTTWVFQILWQVLIVLIIILFQSEIRQVLERVNPLQVIGLRAVPKATGWVSEFVQGIFSLAESRTGALIIFERRDLVKEVITGGVALEGEPNPELLLSIFQKNSPLHDGALVIKDGRISKVACYLPLSTAEGLPKEWGTRHRAALGLSERCDAWVVVVSEERGEISLARGGEMVPVTNQEQLSGLLQSALITPSLPGITLWERVRGLTFRHWPVKIGALVLVSVFWLLLAGQQNFEVALSIPVEIKNVPAKMEILEPTNPEVKITVRGLRKDASTLSNRNVHAEIDLSMARLGNRIFRITRDQVALPNERLSVIHIEPPRIKFTLKETGTNN